MIQFHDIADAFPMMEDDAFDALRADMDANGQREKIRLFEGCILDGRNRYRGHVLSGRIRVEASCDELVAAGLAVWFDPAVDGDPVKWVASLNLMRRHLTPSQLAMAADALATLSVGRPEQKSASLRDSERAGDRTTERAMTQPEAAKLLGVSERSVQTARQVREHGAPELVEAVRQGRASVSAAAAVAELPLEEQEAIVRAVDPRAYARVARERQHAVGGARSIMASRAAVPEDLDFFPTPPWATRALCEDVLGHLGISLAGSSVEDPACGEGHMSGVLEEFADDVRATDIFDYSVDGRSPPCWDGCRDWLAPEQDGSGADWIITNPPFGDRALPFILKALDRAEVGVAMFLRSQWAVEGVERYAELFRDTPPTLCAFFVERVNLCAGRWDPEGSTATAYCWLVWVKGRAPLPPFWIPPGRRAERSLPTDIERFTARPVAPMSEAQRQMLDEQRDGEVVLQTLSSDQVQQLAAPAADLDGGFVVPPEVAAAVLEAIASGAAVIGAPIENRPLSDAEINSIITDGYARNVPVADLARLTGLKPAAVKKRAGRMGLGNRDRQRQAVAEANRKRAAERRESASCA